MTMAEPQPSMASPTRLSLDRCIARGAASVIGMNEETPLAVRWNQGLVITPWHFIATGGSTSNPTRFEDIAINLVHVTPSVAKVSIGREASGCALNRRRGGGSLHFEDRRRARSTISWVTDVLEAACTIRTKAISTQSGRGIAHRGQPDNCPPSLPSAGGLIWSEEQSANGRHQRPALDLSLPPHPRARTILR
jgi:hypothetical protein